MGAALLLKKTLQRADVQVPGVSASVVTPVGKDGMIDAQG